MEERLVYLVMGHKPSEGERCLAVFETAEEAFNFDPPAHFVALVFRPRNAGEHAPVIANNATG